MSVAVSNLPDTVQRWLAEEGGVFAKFEFEVYQPYFVKLRFNERVLGGVPKNPEIIESWIRTKASGNDAELLRLLRKAIEEMDIAVDVPENASRDELMEAAKKVANDMKGNGFMLPPKMGGQLCLGSYQVKAMLREATNIAFPWGAESGEEDESGKKLKNKWGPTKKAPHKYLREAVFVHEAYHYIPLGRTEPDGVHVQVGQITGPQGPRSTLTYYDYVERPEIEFVICSHKDEVKPEQWRDVLIVGQHQGLGAVRSMGHGTFQITEFEKL